MIRVSLVYFLPIIIILLATFSVTSIFIPYPKDEKDENKFGWPNRKIYGFRIKLAMWVCDSLGIVKMDDAAFATFQSYHITFFMSRLTNSRVER